MRWTQENLARVRGYVFAAVAILMVVAYFVTH